MSERSLPVRIALARASVAKARAFVKTAHVDDLKDVLVELKATPMGQASRITMLETELRRRVANEMLEAERNEDSPREVVVSCGPTVSGRVSISIHNGTGKNMEIPEAEKLLRILTAAIGDAKRTKGEGGS